MQTISSVEEYIAGFPTATKKMLKQMRNIIRQTAPDAEEVISYGMPGYKLNGMLVWFAGYQHHIGFYPKGEVIKFFAAKLKSYKTSKGTIQFPLTEELPEKLITEIVQYRIAENNKKATVKRAK